MSSPTHARLALVPACSLSFPSPRLRRSLNPSPSRIPTGSCSRSLRRNNTHPHTRTHITSYIHSPLPISSSMLYLCPTPRNNSSSSSTAARMPPL